MSPDDLDERRRNYNLVFAWRGRRNVEEGSKKGDRPEGVEAQRPQQEGVEAPGAEQRQRRGYIDMARVEQKLADLMKQDPYVGLLVRGLPRGKNGCLGGEGPGQEHTWCHHRADPRRMGVYESILETIIDMGHVKAPAPAAATMPTFSISPAKTAPVPVSEVTTTTSLKVRRTSKASR